MKHAIGNLAIGIASAALIAGCQEKPLRQQLLERLDEQYTNMANEVYKAKLHTDGFPDTALLRKYEPIKYENLRAVSRQITTLDSTLQVVQSHVRIALEEYQGEKK